MRVSVPGIRREVISRGARIVRRAASLHRLRLGLTQEGVVECAGLSAHAIQKLEHGATHPYRETTHRLVRALGLSGEDEGQFRRLGEPARGTRVKPHRYGTQTPRSCARTCRSHSPVLSVVSEKWLT
jgi:DNA-binding XRE family transcriptional regulator